MTDGRGLPARVAQRYRSARLTPTLVGLVVAVAATLSWAAWHRPVLEHDDWDILLPDDRAYVLDHAQRVLNEGRWLNYWWWQLGSRHLSPLAVTLGFAIGWLIVTATLTRVLTRTWWAVPIAVALYASPMAAQISYWPATMVAPMTVLAVASVALALTRHRWRTHLAVLTAALLVLMLAYPPFALLVVPLLVALHADATWPRLAGLAVCVAGSYVAGILVVFALNAARFGVFGLDIQPWRHPTSLTGPSSLLDHLGVVADNSRDLVRVTALPLIAVVVCVVLALLLGERRRLAVLGLAFVLTFGLSSGSTVLNGVDIPFRSASWVWPFGVIAIAWTLHARARPVRVIAGVAVLAVACWSAAYSAELARGHQRFQRVMDTIAARVVALHAQGYRRIVFIPRVSYAANYVDRQTVWQLGNALAKEHGIEVTGHCAAACPKLVAYAEENAPNESVFLHGSTVIVRFPAQVVAHPLDGLPLPRWLTPFA